MVREGEEALAITLGWCCLADSGTWRIGAGLAQGLGLTCRVQCRHEFASFSVMSHGVDYCRTGTLSFIYVRMLRRGLWEISVAHSTFILVVA